MATYRSLLAQKASLDRKIALARKREVGSVIRQINELIVQYDLTAAELTFPEPRAKNSETAQPKRGRKPRAASKTVTAPRYRNPETGETWTGRGRAPKWVVGDKSAYLIDKS